MFELRQDLGFGPEALADQVVAAQWSEQLLDRPRTIERLVPAEDAPRPNSDTTS